MIDINHIPHRYSNSVAMVTKRLLNNSFVLRGEGVLAKIRCHDKFSSIFCRKGTIRDN